MTSPKPGVRPVVPHFSSGPCAKRPGCSLQALTDALTGRSHRSKVGRAKLKRAIDLTREVLGVPAGYRVGIVPARLAAPAVRVVATRASTLVGRWGHSARPFCQGGRMVGGASRPGTRG